MGIFLSSAREKTGRTGFAHLFEHLLFLESENLGRGGLDQLSAQIGGAGANGFTNNDITTYFQTVPKDALEKMIWAKLNLLDRTSAYNWSSDYIREREEIVENMTIDRIQSLSNQYLDINQMVWVVVGDAKTQKDRLKELGFGEVVLLN